MVAAAENDSRGGLELYTTNLSFIAEEQKIHRELRPQLATTVRVMVSYHAISDYSAPDATGTPAIVVAPYAGHSAMIAVFHKGQSLMERCSPTASTACFSPTGGEPRKT